MRTLCLEMLQTKEVSSFLCRSLIISCVGSAVEDGVLMLRFRLDVATIILNCSFLILFTDFSILTPLMTVLTEFSSWMRGQISIHCQYRGILYLHNCVGACVLNTYSVLCSTVDAVSSGFWTILFKLLTLNVTICIVLLYLSKCFVLEFCSWDSDYLGRSSNLSRMCPFFTRAKSMHFRHIFWVRVIVIFQWPIFNLTNRRYSVWWVVVVSRVDNLILATDL